MANKFLTFDGNKYEKCIPAHLGNVFNDYIYDEMALHVLFDPMASYGNIPYTVLPMMQSLYKIYINYTKSMNYRDENTQNKINDILDNASYEYDPNKITSNKLFYLGKEKHAFAIYLETDDNYVTAHVYNSGYGQYNSNPLTSWKIPRKIHFDNANVSVVPSGEKDITLFIYNIFGANFNSVQDVVDMYIDEYLNANKSTSLYIKNKHTRQFIINQISKKHPDVNPITEFLNLKPNLIATTYEIFTKLFNAYLKPNKFELYTQFGGSCTVNSLLNFISHMEKINNSPYSFRNFLQSYTLWGYYAGISSLRTLYDELPNSIYTQLCNFLQLLNGPYAKPYENHKFKTIKNDSEKILLFSELKSEISLYMADIILNYKYIEYSKLNYTPKIPAQKELSIYHDIILDDKLMQQHLQFIDFLNDHKIDVPSPELMTNFIDIISLINQFNIFGRDINIVMLLMTQSYIINVMSKLSYVYKNFLEELQKLTNGEHWVKIYKFINRFLFTNYVLDFYNDKQIFTIDLMENVYFVLYMMLDIFCISFDKYFSYKDADIRLCQTVNISLKKYFDKLNLTSVYQFDYSSIIAEKNIDYSHLPHIIDGKNLHKNPTSDINESTLNNWSKEITKDDERLRPEMIFHIINHGKETSPNYRYLQFLSQNILSLLCGTERTRDMTPTIKSLPSIFRYVSLDISGELPSFDDSNQQDENETKIVDTYKYINTTNSHADYANSIIGSMRNVIMPLYPSESKRVDWASKIYNTEYNWEVLKTEKTQPCLQLTNYLLEGEICYAFLDNIESFLKQCKVTKNIYYVLDDIISCAFAARPLDVLKLKLDKIDTFLQIMKANHTLLMETKELPTLSLFLGKYLPTMLGVPMLGRYIFRSFTNYITGLRRLFFNKLDNCAFFKNAAKPVSVNESAKFAVEVFNILKTANVPEFVNKNISDMMWSTTLEWGYFYKIRFTAKPNVTYAYVKKNRTVIDWETRKGFSKYGWFVVALSEVFSVESIITDTITLSWPTDPYDYNDDKERMILNNRNFFPILYYAHTYCKMKNWTNNHFMGVIEKPTHAFVFEYKEDSNSDSTMLLYYFYQQNTPPQEYVYVHDHTEFEKALGMRYIINNSTFLLRNKDTGKYAIYHGQDKNIVISDDNGKFSMTYKYIPKKNEKWAIVNRNILFNLKIIADGDPTDKIIPIHPSGMFLENSTEVDNTYRLALAMQKESLLHVAQCQTNLYNTFLQIPNMHIYKLYILSLTGTPLKSPFLSYQKQMFMDLLKSKTLTDNMGYVLETLSHIYDHIKSENMDIDNIIGYLNDQIRETNDDIENIPLNAKILYMMENSLIKMMSNNETALRVLNLLTINNILNTTLDMIEQLSALSDIQSYEMDRALALINPSLLREKFDNNDNNLNKSVYIIEILSGFVATKKQMHTLQTLINAEKRPVQLVMGAGKTSFITPALILNYLFDTAMETNFVRIMLPEHLVTQSEQVMRNTLGRFFQLCSITAQTYDKCPKNKAYDVQDFQVKSDDMIYIHVVGFRATQHFYHYKTSLSFNPAWESNECFTVVDEIDSIVRPNTCEMNVPQNMKNITSEEAFNTYIDFLVEWGGAMNDIKKETNAATILREKWPGYYYLIKKTLKQACTMEYRKDYGFEHPELLGTIAMPYAAANTPATGSSFSDIDLRLALTYMCYIDIFNTGKNCGRKPDFDLLITFIKLQYSHRINHPVDMLRVGLGQILEIIGNQSKLLEIIIKAVTNTNHMTYFDEYKKYVEEDANIKSRMALANVIFRISVKNTVYATEEKTIGALECLEGKLRMFTGTVTIPVPLLDHVHFSSSFPIEAVIKNDDDEAFIDQALKTMEVERLAMPNLPTDASKQTIINVREEAFLNYIKTNVSKYKCAIDVAGILRNLSVQEYVDKLRTMIQMPILYVNNGTRLKMSLEGATTPYTPKDLDIQNNNVFYFYDQASCIGIDFKQPLRLWGTITVNENVTRTELAQGAFRLRQLNRGHNAVMLAFDDNIYNNIKSPEHRLQFFNDIEQNNAKHNDWLAYLQQKNFQLNKHTYHTHSTYNNFEISKNLKCGDYIKESIFYNTMMAKLLNTIHMNNTENVIKFYKTLIKSLIDNSETRKNIRNVFQSHFMSNTKNVQTQIAEDVSVQIMTTTNTTVVIEQFINASSSSFSKSRILSDISNLNLETHAFPWHKYVNGVHVIEKRQVYVGAEMCHMMHNIARKVHPFDLPIYSTYISFFLVDYCDKWCYFTFNDLLIYIHLLTLTSGKLNGHMHIYGRGLPPVSVDLANVRKQIKLTPLNNDVSWLIRRGILRDTMCQPPSQDVANLVDKFINESKGTFMESLFKSFYENIFEIYDIPITAVLGKLSDKNLTKDDMCSTAKNRIQKSRVTGDDGFINMYPKYVFDF